MMRVKNHQIPPTILVERALGMSSDPSRKSRESGQRRAAVRTGEAWPGLSTLQSRVELQGKEKAAKAQENQGLEKTTMLTVY